MSLSSDAITDAALEHFAGNPLTSLHLRSKNVTDAGLAHIKPCKLLGELKLAQTRVMGTGFVHLKALPSLSRLHLAECPVTDEGLGALSECFKLRWLGLQGVRLNAASVKKLSAALPQCKIEWEGRQVEPNKAVDPPAKPRG